MPALDALTDLIGVYDTSAGAHSEMVIGDLSQAMIDAGANITLTPNPTTGKLSIAVSGVITTVANTAPLGGDGTVGNPLTVSTATTAARGVVELATDAETQAGGSTTLAVTPFGLNSRTATTGRTGLVELATDAETQARGDSSRAVTPAGLGSLFGALNLGSGLPGNAAGVLTNNGGGGLSWDSSGGAVAVPALGAIGAHKLTSVVSGTPTPQYSDTVDGSVIGEAGGTWQNRGNITYNSGGTFVTTGLFVRIA